MSRIAIPLSPHQQQWYTRHPHLYPFEINHPLFFISCTFRPEPRRLESQVNTVQDMALL